MDNRLRVVKLFTPAPGPGASSSMTLLSEVSYARKGPECDFALFGSTRTRTRSYTGAARIFKVLRSPLPC